MGWRKTVKIKQFLTSGTSHEEVQKAMNNIASELDKHSEFPKTLIEKMKNVPTGDEDFKPEDYANKFLDKMYDIANRERIWIE
jgi:hypothetical protein